MKRRVIQIANSTQLVSLPRKWTLKYGVTKGEEIDVLEDGNKLIISTDKVQEFENKVLEAEKWKEYLPRVIYSLYKKGVDEIRANFRNPETLKVIQKSLGKQTVGFEIIDQGNNYCIIKNVSGDLEDFDSVLRRTFLILIQMSKEIFESIKNLDYNHLNSVAFLEESNNRFTTTCRRLLNKKGYKNYKHTGPMYYMIEELENTADQYKYICNYIANMNPKTNPPSKDTLDLMAIVNESLQLFYETFYKFDESKIVRISQNRSMVVSKSITLFGKKGSLIDNILLHHELIIMQKIFCLTGPYLITVL
ncbi:MAG TPA: AbrB/MazE/SpoVT family DNA-binding domain-containing protein [Candidatus Nanoarchaeia archaeon]|nr:AbrB/MazE/SpoVT family DNA-binding domain-containing protein [Candidatus Nanoarchaeia archaeon]